MKFADALSNILLQLVETNELKLPGDCGRMGHQVFVCRDSTGGQVCVQMYLKGIVGHVWCVLPPGQAIKAPLQPLEVGRPFHHVSVDVLQLPLTYSSNQYAVVLIDYMTKWVEMFAVANQTEPL